MGNPLFQRTWRVTVGGLNVSELDLTFDVEKSTKREPNTAEINVYNLSETSRSKISEEEDPTVTLRAGYEADGDQPPVLFVGDARRIFTAADGIDFVTTIQARDLGRAYQAARMNKSYGPGTPISTALRDAVDALGVGRGNLSEFDVTLSNGARNFATGFVASGQAHRVLNSLVRGAGLRWSIQNGSLQLMQRRQALQTRAVLLSPDSGLVESPTKDEKGIVTARCLMQTGLEPGRRVSIESRLLSGTYEIRKTKYEGDTRGNAWHAIVECKSSQ